MSRPESPPDVPVLVTFETAQAFCRWASSQSGERLGLPSEAQLTAALYQGVVVTLGPEWTSEGYILDGNTLSCNQSPEPGATAYFRPIRL